MALRNIPIRRKLTLIILGTSAVGLMLMCTGFFVYEYFTFRHSSRRQLETLGQIVATNCTAALAFENREDAAAVLSALRAEPHIRVAALYDRHGQLFALYPAQPPARVPAAGPPAEGYRFDGGRLVGVQSIVQAPDAPRLGTLYLESDLAAMYDRFRLYGGIAALVIAVSFGAAYLIARRLQHQISRPVLALAEVARSVSAGRDYSVRASKWGRDEIGLLTDAFNHMLARIEEQTVALREREARVRAVFNSALNAVFVVDAQGLLTDWNARAETMFGWRRDEAIGRRLADTLVPPAAGRSRPHHDYITPDGRPHPCRQIETIARRRDGTVFPVELSISPIRDGPQETFCGFVTDITERKLADARIQAHIQRLALLSEITRAIGERQDLPSVFHAALGRLEENLPLDFGCVCLYDRADHVLTVTSLGPHSAEPAAALGLTPDARLAIDENGLARCIRGDLVYEPDTRHVPFPFPQRLAQGGFHALAIAPLRVESSVFGVLVAARREAQSFSSSECEFLRQLSEHVSLAANQAQVYTALQEAYDELRQTQQSALQQERLRALGQMASGIAHDINNAISPITLYTESLLANDPTLSPRARDYLTTIQHSIQDVAQTVSRMREFYRPREPQLALLPVEPNRLLEQVADLTRARWYDMPQQRGIVIELVRQFSPDLPPLLGLESELREALINLVFNAVDAMPEGGRLVLRSALVEESFGPVASTRRIALEVADSGVGMDEETRRRCLEPFFTTKGERGTGLGLAMVYGTIKRHGAEIEIDTAPGQGTTVRLLFPTPTTSGGAILHHEEPPRPRERLRLLLIDDDPVLLRSLHDTLRDDGHDIVTAPGGQAGIDAFLAAQRQGHPFAAVITDLGMPHVDGRRVAAAIKEASPTTPVFLLTGWGQRLIAEGDTPPHVDRVLNKPPQLRDLRAALLTVGEAPRPS